MASLTGKAGKFVLVMFGTLTLAEQMEVTGRCEWCKTCLCGATHDGDTEAVRKAFKENGPKELYSAVSELAGIYAGNQEQKTANLKALADKLGTQLQEALKADSGDLAKAAKAINDGADTKKDALMGTEGALKVKLAGIALILEHMKTVDGAEQKASDEEIEKAKNLKDDATVSNLTDDKNKFNGKAAVERLDLMVKALPKMEERVKAEKEKATKGESNNGGAEASVSALEKEPVQGAEKAEVPNLTRPAKGKKGKRGQKGPVPRRRTGV